MTKQAGTHEKEDGWVRCFKDILEAHLTEHTLPANASGLLNQKEEGVFHTKLKVATDVSVLTSTSLWQLHL